MMATWICQCGHYFGQETQDKGQLEPFWRKMLRIDVCGDDCFALMKPARGYELRLSVGLLLRGMPIR